MTCQFFTLRRIAAVLVILAVPLFAAGETKRRAVAPHASALATLTGTVTDSTTGAPVVLVAVSNVTGQLLGTTDAKGQFTAKIAPAKDVPLTFTRVGYNTVTTTVNISGDATRSFQLASKPVTTIRLITGATAQVDTDTIQFGYLVSFVGYTADTTLNLCTAGGHPFTPDRADIQKITGPSQLNDAQCCSKGPVPAVNVQLKSGETTTGGFVDACVGYVVDLIGKDHVTAKGVSFHFSDIAEVDFP